jgi:hypothetical protein
MLLLISFSVVAAFSMASDSLTSELHFQSPDTQVSLIEVYSSQGCSSCPPAQRWVNEFTKENRLWQGVIPLVFHVDYWNYIGWSDPFAQAQFSKRQSTYKQAGRINSVYTPGFVFNGNEWRGWFSSRQLPRINKIVGVLAVDIDKHNLALEYRPAKSKDITPGATPLEINIALLGFGLRTKVKRGENARFTLAEEFVVLEHQRQLYDPDSTEIPWPKTSIKAKQYAVVVWLTEQSTLRPFPAAGGYIPGNWAVL